MTTGVVAHLFALGLGLVVLSLICFDGLLFLLRTRRK